MLALLRLPACRPGWRLACRSRLVGSPQASSELRATSLEAVADRALTSRGSGVSELGIAGKLDAGLWNPSIRRGVRAEPC